jgi:predicted esterase
MRHRLVPVTFLMSMLASVAAARAQVLADAQVAAIRDAVAATGGELAALRAFDADLELPADLSRTQVEALRSELLDAYRDGIVAANSEQYRTLGDLPPTLEELTERAEDGRPELTTRTMPLREFRMPFRLVRREASGVPEAGRPMFICTHGGGGNGNVDGPHAWDVNSREWNIQSRFATGRYEPEGLYFVPRMADDRRGRWRHAHHLDQFELAIRHGILFWGVDPNRVYKLGISQGGFASAIIGAFMPDLFAAINPMAGGVGLGNPVENLRNLPCFTSIGENDTMFNRVGNAVAWHARLDELHAADPTGYRDHVLDLQAGRGHGIDYRPGAPWIARFTRDPRPEAITWVSTELDGRRRDSMYWLELEGDALRGRIELTARIDRDRNRVDVTAHQLATRNATGDPTQIAAPAAEPVPLTGARVAVLLDDALLDLDREVVITCNGETVFAGRVRRDAGTLLETLVRRGDPNYAFPVRVPIRLESPAGSASRPAVGEDG